MVVAIALDHFRRRCSDYDPLSIFPAPRVHVVDFIDKRTRAENSDLRLFTVRCCSTGGLQTLLTPLVTHYTYQKKTVALLEDNKLVSTAAIIVAESPTWQPDRRSEQTNMES